jgi:hypothetical protein
VYWPNTFSNIQRLFNGNIFLESCQLATLAHKRLVPADAAKDHGNVWEQILFKSKGEVERVVVRTDDHIGLSLGILDVPQSLEFQKVLFREYAPGVHEFKQQLDPSFILRKG